MGAKKDLKKLKRKVNALERTVETYSAKVDSHLSEVEGLLAEFSQKITGLLQANRKTAVAPASKPKAKKRK